MTDPVADALIRIKNGYASFKTEVILPYSKLILVIAKVLEEEGYIVKVKEETKEGTSFKQIKVGLRYEDRKPALTMVKRISKPGLRVYSRKKSLPYVLNGLGIALVSTPKGIMSDKKARKEGLGGEVMAFVW